MGKDHILPGYPKSVQESVAALKLHGSGVGLV
jgi:hypothetical protein